MLNKTGRLRKNTKIVALATSLLLILAACAPQSGTDKENTAVTLPPLSEITPAQDPTAITGPVTVQLPETPLTPIADLPEQQLPVTVSSKHRNGDTTVEVTDTSRIVPLSLGGSVADYVYSFGFGDNIVGRDISTVIPEIEEVPVVTKGGHSIDAESVLALNPSLIITDGTIGPIDVIDQFADAGVAVVYVTAANSYEQSFEQAQQIAAALGVAAAGPEYVDTLRAEIAQKEAEIAAWIADTVTTRPKVAFLYMRGEGVFYLFGEGSGIDALFNSVGVTDVATAIDWQGQRPMNDEALIAADPDTILVLTKGLESVGGVEGMLAVHPAVALTTAGKTKRIYDVSDTGLFTGAPRATSTLDGLARAFYAPESLQ